MITSFQGGSFRYTFLRYTFIVYRTQINMNIELWYVYSKTYLMTCTLSIFQLFFFPGESEDI